MNLALEICGALALAAWAALYFGIKRYWPPLSDAFISWVGVTHCVSLDTWAKSEGDILTRLNDLTAQVFQQRAEIDQLNLILNESKPAEKPVTEIRAKSWREFQEIANR